MSSLILRLVAPIASLVLAVVAFAPVSAFAQEEAPARISIRLADVKSDSVAQFESAIADIGRTMQAGGMPFFHVYERVRGNLPGYSIIQMDGNFNDMPGVELDDAVLDRINHSLNGNTHMTVVFMPEYGISTGSVEPSGRYMRVRVRTTSPANAQAFLDAQREEVVPALRAAGIEDRRFGRVMLGGNQNTFVNFTYSDEFPGTGGGNAVAETMGQRNFERMIARLNSVVATAEDLVYVFRPDLSFTAE